MTRIGKTEKVERVPEPIRAPNIVPKKQPATVPLKK